MENVVTFNNELSGLYESKPPISKAKMAAITKSAMRAIKFYKHVVQSVEKFILKCKPEYKIPGLYVIDSIVRQSRHQYGPDKDVFAPRFARNMKETFANLFRCASDDKSRIIRVLNLWQKNNVFAPEVIQPIFDLADPNHPIYSMPVAGSTSGNAGTSGAGAGDISQANGLNSSNISMEGAGSQQQQQQQQQQQGDDKMSGGPGGLADLSCLSPHERSRNVTNTSHKQHATKRSSQTTSNAPISSTSSKTRDHSKSTLESIKIHHPETYNKYQRNSSHEYEDSHHHVDDDNSSVECASPHNSSNLLDNNNLKQLLNDPNVLRQLQTLQNFQKFKQDEKQHNFRMQEEAFEKHLQNVLKNSAGVSSNQDNDFSKEVEFVSEEPSIEVINLDGNDSRSPTPDRDRYKRRRSRSRSRSREQRMGRRRRSRSRSRSRSPRTNRRRNSRERERSNRDKEKDREMERERRKKGLPDIKKDHLSVCSTTLWVGHLSKLVYQEELSDTFGEFGDIVSIDQIVPRGCAFIVMNRRQDAYKAMQNLKSHKLQGRVITISWAAGKGVKSKEWKDYWDLELGVTYIPWHKIDVDTDFDVLEEGGMFDEESMPGWMKEKIHKIKRDKEVAGNSTNVTSVGPPPVLPPPSANPAMMFGIDTTQPPPGHPQTAAPPPPMMSMVPGQFSMAPPMGGPPRMMGGPPHMSMPMSGLHMPPNMVPPHPGHPSHPMMMMQGFGLPNQVGGPGGPPPLAPHIPPPMGGNSHGQHPAQFAPPPGRPPMSGNVSTDDQMDIEMEDAEGATLASDNPTTAAVASMNFNQPPPSFGLSNTSNDKNLDTGKDGGGFPRDHNRPPSSRWERGAAGIGGGGDNDEELHEPKWNEAVMSGRNNAPPNFPDNRGGPGNVLQRPEFPQEFENRGGMRVGGPPNFNGGGGEFNPNMQNRFNHPTNLMQMRIPPPNVFSQRGGRPPMFMRGGQANQGGGPGRQQAPGFFNRNNPFMERDNNNFGGGRGGVSERGGGGNGGRGGAPVGNMSRGGMSGRDSGGKRNWSDEDDDEYGGFKRRGNSSNRFRDKEGSADRYSNSSSMRDRGGRRNLSGSRERTVEKDNRGRPAYGNRRSMSHEETPKNDDIPKSKPTADFDEEDWDADLKDEEPVVSKPKNTDYSSSKAKNEEPSSFESKSRNTETLDKQPKYQQDSFESKSKNKETFETRPKTTKEPYYKKAKNVDSEEDWDNDDDDYYASNDKKQNESKTDESSKANSENTSKTIKEDQPVKTLEKELDTTTAKPNPSAASSSSAAAAAPPPQPPLANKNDSETKPINNSAPAETAAETKAPPPQTLNESKNENTNAITTTPPAKTEASSGAAAAAATDTTAVKQDVVAAVAKESNESQPEPTNAPPAAAEAAAE